MTLGKQSPPFKLVGRDAAAGAHRAPAKHRTPAYLRYKPLGVRLLAAGMLVLAAPGLTLLLLLVRLTSRGRAIYRQTRVGLGGRTFTMYKIRTMRRDAERLTGAVWAAKCDRRVTRIGRFLRRTHLDEVPQLWNIVRGEMCLIGPRPERPEFVERLMKEIPNYAERLTVLPGVTGLAQIQLPPDVDLRSVRRKLIADVRYIRRRSFLLDLKIVLCTLLQLFGMRVVAKLPICRIEPVFADDESQRPVGAEVISDRRAA